MNLLNKTLLIGGIFFALIGIGEVTAVLIVLGWAVLTVVKSFS